MPHSISASISTSFSTSEGKLRLASAVRLFAGGAEQRPLQPLFGRRALGEMIAQPFVSSQAVPSSVHSSGCTGSGLPPSTNGSRQDQLSKHSPKLMG